MSNKKPPAGTQKNDTEEKNISENENGSTCVDPRIELHALSSCLKAHLLRLEKQGKWGVPKGSPIVDFQEPDDSRKGYAPPVHSGFEKSGHPAVEAASGHIDRDMSKNKDKSTEESGTRDVTSELERTDLPGLPGLMRIRALMGPCARCPLHETRNNIVFGEGNPEADLVFIGEAPGFEEDRSGVPFVGPAGSLFTKMLKAMGLQREEVYIANILKCRPPRNRDPLPDEAKSCKPFLLAQLRCIQPSIIVTLGRVAAQNLFETDAPISALRGEFRDWNEWKVMPTYHPAYLLRNKNMKRPAWEDLQAVMAEMDRMELKRRR